MVNLYDIIKLKWTEIRIRNQHLNLIRWWGKWWYAIKGENIYLIILLIRFWSHQSIVELFFFHASHFPNFLSLPSPCPCLWFYVFAIKRQCISCFHPRLNICNKGFAYVKVKNVHKRTLFNVMPNCSTQAAHWQVLTTHYNPSTYFCKQRAPPFLSLHLLFFYILQAALSYPDMPWSGTLRKSKFPWLCWFGAGARRPFWDSSLGRGALGGRGCLWGEE